MHGSTFPHLPVTRPPGCCGRLWPGRRWTATPPQWSPSSLTELKRGKTRQTLAVDTEYQELFRPSQDQTLCAHRVVQRDCKKTKQGHSLGSFPGAVQQNRHWGALLFQGCTDTRLKAGSVLNAACRLHVTGFVGAQQELSGAERYREQHGCA